MKPPNACSTMESKHRHIQSYSPQRVFDAFLDWIWPTLSKLSMETRPSETFFAADCCFRIEAWPCALATIARSRCTPSWVGVYKHNDRSQLLYSWRNFGPPAGVTASARLSAYFYNTTVTWQASTAGLGPQTFSMDVFVHRSHIFICMCVLVSP